MKKKHESGRTMVELIAVIALMGFVAVIGFAGYQFTLEYLRGKNMVESFYQVKALMLTKKIRTNMQLAEFLVETDVKKYMVDIQNDTDEKHIIVKLNTMPISICTRLYDNFAPDEFKVLIGDTDISGNKCDLNEGGKVWLLNAMLNDRHEIGPSGLVTDSFTKPDKIPECGKGQLMGTDGYCYSCYTQGAIPLSTLDCNKCDNREMVDGLCVQSKCGVGVMKNKPLTGLDGECYSCDEKKYIPVTSADCGLCENREMRDGGCALVCDEGYFLSTSGYCYDCDVSSDIKAEEKDCYLCLQREVWGELCILEKCGKGSHADEPFTDNNGNCYACTGDLVYNATKNTCVGCNVASDCNSGGVCYQNVCTYCLTSTPYWDSSLNECTKCPYAYPIWNADYLKCEACPNELPYFNLDTDACEVCPDDVPVWNGSNCEACAVSTPKTPVWDNDMCISCADDNINTPVWDSKNEKCINCVLADSAKPYWNGEYCVSCVDGNSDTPFWNGSECRSCENADSDKPYWNGKDCVSCATENGAAAPYWTGDYCDACPADIPYWTGSDCQNCEKLNELKPYYNGTSCVSCESDNSSTPYWYNESCVSCASVDDTKPYFNGSACVVCPAPIDFWDGENCVACSSIDEDKPYWNGRACQACPSWAPYWNGSRCKSCVSVNSKKPYWNGRSCVSCESVNSEKPYWNGRSCKSCVSVNSEKPYWNGSSCVSCKTANSSTPYWTGSVCSECPLYASKNGATDKEIGSTGCYCESGYAVNTSDNACITLESRCAILSAQNSHWYYSDSMCQWSWQHQHGLSGWCALNGMEFLWRKRCSTRTGYCWIKCG